MTNDRLWDATDKLQLIALAALKGVKGDEEHLYLPLFDNHSEGKAC